MTNRRILLVAWKPEGNPLQSLSPEWEILSVPDYPKAIDTLSLSLFDAVVVDPSVAPDESANFLNALAKTHPKVLRLVLIDSENRQILDKCTGLAPQCLPRKCDSGRLLNMLERSFQTADWMDNEVIKRLVSQVRDLPSPTTLYQEILRKLQSPNVVIEEVALLIAQDPAMCAKMLKIVNSAFFALARDICDVFEAVIFLGLERTKALILFTHYVSLFQAPKTRRFSIDALWQHSLMTATYARLILQGEIADSQKADEAFTAGLLHDIGKLMLAANMPELYDQSLALGSERHISDWQAEREIVGATHDILGACLLGIWGLPMMILEAVAWHHQPSLHSGKQFSLLTAVHVANGLAGRTGGKGQEKGPAEIDFGYLNEIGMADHYGFWHDLCSGFCEQEKPRIRRPTDRANPVPSTKPVEAPALDAAVSASVP
jgi:putative nucleotidyltransferase with HDIG domain